MRVAWQRVAHTAVAPLQRLRLQSFPPAARAMSAKTSTDPTDQTQTGSQTARQADVPQTVTFYHSPPSLAVQAASVVFGVKAVGAVAGGLYWGAKVLTEVREASLLAAEAGSSVASASVELSGGAISVWGPPMLIGVGAVTWAVMRRMVKKVVLQLDYTINADGDEAICITSMPVLPLLEPHTLIVDRANCEAAIGHVLTPNFYSLPGGRWYLLPVPGWSSQDKDYLKVFLYWRYFREEKPEAPDETLIAIEGFGPYRPMQFADPNHPAAKQLGWPATEKELTHSPFKAINGDVYAEFEVGRRLSVAERQRFTAKQQLLGQAAADTYLQKQVEAPQDEHGEDEHTGNADGSTSDDESARR